MKHFQYQRSVIGYHGCEQAVRDRVIAGDGKLNSSENDYDWLGKGIYFWEYGPERALGWAKEQKRRGRIKKPAVIGAIIHLGHSFDLLDIRFTQTLKEAYPSFVSSLNATGKSLPENQPLSANDDDLLLRRGDCALINWIIPLLEKTRTGLMTRSGGFSAKELRFFPDLEFTRKTTSRSQSGIHLASQGISCHREPWPKRTQIVQSKSKRILLCPLGAR